MGKTKPQLGSHKIYTQAASVLRRDMGRIIVGRKSSTQDNCTLHRDARDQCTVGDYVTVGHNAVIHEAKIHELGADGLVQTITLFLRQVRPSADTGCEVR
jgi:hypothetical protein